MTGEVSAVAGVLSAMAGGLSASAKTSSRRAEADSQRRELSPSVEDSIPGQLSSTKFLLIEEKQAEGSEVE